MTAEQIVKFIANDSWELSQEKMQAQYAEYKKLCKEYIDERAVSRISTNVFYDNF